jgi:hypothetical protein
MLAAQRRWLRPPLLLLRRSVVSSIIFSRQAIAPRPPVARLLASALSTKNNSSSKGGGTAGDDSAVGDGKQQHHHHHHHHQQQQQTQQQQPADATAAGAGAGATDGCEGLERVCVVGTGPAGFYFARYLLREHPTVRVDLIDALPHPFGLVRTGVAPDHPEVKSVENDFDATAREHAGRLQFLGNVRVGGDGNGYGNGNDEDKHASAESGGGGGGGAGDIPLRELRKMYNAVVLACGAQSDRRIGVPGEDLVGCLPSRPFVNWYNGHPDYVGALCACVRAAGRAGGRGVLALL